MPDGAQALDDLAQPGNGRGPGHAEASLVVCAYLRAQPQDEAPAGQRSEVPGRVGQRHRAAGKAQSDSRADLQIAAAGGSQPKLDERVVVYLGGPQPVESGSA